MMSTPKSNTSKEWTRKTEQEVHIILPIRFININEYAGLFCIYNKSEDSSLNTIKMEKEDDAAIRIFGETSDFEISITDVSF